MLAFPLFRTVCFSTAHIPATIKITGELLPEPCAGLMQPPLDGSDFGAGDGGYLCQALVFVLEQHNGLTLPMRQMRESLADLLTQFDVEQVRNRFFFSVNRRLIF